MIKQFIKNQINKRPKLIRKIIAILAKMHNYSYHKIAELSSVLEEGLHPKHRITKYHQFFIDRVDINDTVLDVGCGIGLLAYGISEKAKSVAGVDFSKPNINYAKENYKRPNLNFILGDVTTYKFEGKFDKIILSNVLEHIDDRVALLKTLNRLSDTILFRVPMEDRDWITIYKKEMGLEYRLDITHRIEYRLDTIEKELKESGWKIEEYKVVWGEFWGVLKKDENS